MPTISLAIQKGGAGKTTTAINLAAALQQMGRSVLLVDLDPQANLTHALGLTEADESLTTIYQLLKQEMGGATADLRSIILETQTGLVLAPAGLELADAELELVATYGREQLLQRMLEPLGEAYDYILIDCPPAVGMLTVNALVASDYIIMPLQAEFLPLKGLQSFNKHYQHLQRSLNPNLRLLGLVLSRYDRRKKQHQRVRQILEEDYPGLLFDTAIRTNVALAESQEAGLDIYQFAPQSNGASDYLFLAHELEQRLAAITQAS
ncbi:MAG: ParA family protein [Bacteroidota bacterium]